MNLIRLVMNGYLSFKDETFDCSDRDGIFLVVGRNDANADETDGNGSGKTSLISAHRFAWYGKIRGQFSKDLLNEDVVYKNENDERADKCTVESVSIINDVYFRVVRTVNKKGSQTLDLYTSFTDGDWKCLTLKAGENKRTGKRESGIVRTQNRIVDVVGCDDELFMNSSYFEQANIDTFSRGSLSEKDNTFKSAIGLTKWDDYKTIMKGDMSVVENEIKKSEYLMDDLGDEEGLVDILEETNTLLVDAKIEMKTVNNDASKQIKQLKKIQDDITKVQGELKTFSEQKQKQSDHLRLRESLVDSMSTQIDDIEALEAILTQSNINVDGLKKRLSDIKSEGLTVKSELGDTGIPSEDVDELQKTLLGHQMTQQGIHTQMQAIVDRGRQFDKAELSKCEYGLDCPLLTPEKIKDIKGDLRTQYVNKQKQAKKLGRTISGLTHMIERSKVQVTLSEKLERLKTEYKTTKTNLDDSVKNMNSTRKNILKSGVILNDTEKKLDAVKKCIDSLKKIDVSELEEKLKVLNVTKSELDDSIDVTNCLWKSVQKQIIVYQKDIESHQSDLDKYRELEKTFMELQDKKRVIKTSMHIVGTEIPHILISQSVPQIHQYASDFIKRLSGSRLDMEFRVVKELKTKGDTPNEKDALDPYVCVDGRWLKYESTSGGERTRADVAIHLAWICFQCGRSGNKVETLFLDEVGSALDRSGMQNLIEILHELIGEYGFKKIFFISQNPDCKKYIDNRIVVTKTVDGSRVVYE